MNCSYGSSLSLSPQSFVPRRCLYSRPAAGFLCQQSTKEIVCDDYEEEWKKSYEKTIEVTSEAEIFVQRSPIMMMRTTPPASLPSHYDLKRQFLSGYKNLKAQICNKKMSFWNFLAKNSKFFFIIPRHSPSPMELIHTLKTIFIAIKMVKMA